MTESPRKVYWQWVQPGEHAALVLELVEEDDRRIAILRERKRDWKLTFDESYREEFGFEVGGILNKADMDWLEATEFAQALMWIDGEVVYDRSRVERGL